MAAISATLQPKLALFSQPHPGGHYFTYPSTISVGFSSRTRRRFWVVAASPSFHNQNREFVIFGGGNAAGYAARTFVEHGMADGRLCIVTKEAHASYERPALTKAYLFPPEKGPARLPGFHTFVGSGGERQTPDWYQQKGIEMFYEEPVTSIDMEKQTLTTISGKLLKYGSLIVATGSTAARLSDVRCFSMVPIIAIGFVACGCICVVFVFGSFLLVIYPIQLFLLLLPCL